MKKFGDRWLAERRLRKLTKCNSRTTIGHRLVVLTCDVVSPYSQANQLQPNARRYILLLGANQNTLLPVPVLVVLAVPDLDERGPRLFHL
ncbi:hypothetical protein CEXT_52321 [Caerostris extrusa]|uniref:Uncharacterized protein n=1 Tax=Caerostris extrusa TaxID=172846 RepID=A0AAV4Y5W2_CAEEX|nr:hypothetical protein CEXT_52321 [Caerostris extrusa]